MQGKDTHAEEMPTMKGLGLCRQVGRNFHALQAKLPLSTPARCSTPIEDGNWLLDIVKWLARLACSSEPCSVGANILKPYDCKVGCDLSKLIELQVQLGKIRTPAESRGREIQRS